MSIHDEFKGGSEKSRQPVTSKNHSRSERGVKDARSVAAAQAKFRSTIGHAVSTQRVAMFKSIANRSNVESRYVAGGSLSKDSVKNSDTSLQRRSVAQRDEDDAQGDSNKPPTPEEAEIIEAMGGVVQLKAESGSNTIGGQGPVVQRAYVARRPLGGKVSFGLSSRWFKNKGVFHEHIFFEDDDDPTNIGFHSGTDKLFQDSPEMIALYSKIGPKYDDGAMRAAVKAVGDPGDYSLLGNNCQAYVGKVLAAYKEPIELDTL